MQTIISLVQKRKDFRFFVSILTVFFYAFQHPLTNPFYRTVAQDSVGQMRALLICEAALLIAYLGLLTISEVRIGIKKIIFDINSFGVIILSMITGYASLYTYMIAQSSLSPNELSMILNASPMTSVAVAFIISRQKFDRSYFIVASILSIFIVGLTYFYSDKNQYWSFDLSGYTAALLTPALFYTTIQIIAEKFKDNPQKLIGAITFSSILGSSLMMMVIGVYFLQSDISFHYDKANYLIVVLMIIGTVVPAFFGRILYHITLEVYKRSQEQISIQFYLIPAFTVSISYVLYRIYPEATQEPKLYQLSGIVVVVGVLMIYSEYKKRNK
ncbi:hypothetical protein [Azospirillum sp. B506]|uniref:hypothetical protein n=1 Tax=Azospirillum sp. B506 TaxID=137721 RepID=UPI000347DBC4|nr:hypothetical protein [Azospirillum sp. B506]